jgi:hypothetical protein
VTTHRLSRATGSLVAVVALLAAGCSGDDEPVAETTPTVPGVPELPAGAATPGAEFGQHQEANVVFVPPGDAKGPITAKTSAYLRIRIDRVRTGSISDLSSFDLNARTRRSTPYYVNVTLTGLDKGRIGGADVPLLGVNAHHTLLRATHVIGTFARCQTEPIPDRFSKGTRFDTCLMFLSPKHGKLTGVEFQYSPKAAPVLWNVKPRPR